MPVYNAEDYLNEAIQSILNQTYTNFEFIIINDGSSDSSQEIIESFDDERIILINKDNEGVASALNDGIKVAKGSWIMRMDADDISVNNRLERLLEHVTSNPQIDVLGSSAQNIDEQGAVLGTSTKPLSNIQCHWRCMFNNPFLHPTIIMKTSIVQKVKGYRIVKSEDNDLWTRLYEQAIFENISEPLLLRRLHANQVTNTLYNPENSKEVYASKRRLYSLYDVAITYEVFDSIRHKRINTKTCAKDVIKSVEALCFNFIKKHKPNEVADQKYIALSLTRSLKPFFSVSNRLYYYYYYKKWFRIIKQHC